MLGRMRAIVREGGQVRLREAPAPAAADGDVLVAVRRAGICRTDVYVADGRITVAEPRVLGHELSGVVVEGPGFEAGERVTIIPALRCALRGAMPCAACMAGSPCAAPSMLGVDRDGAFATFVRAPAGAVMRLPPGTSWESGAMSEPLAAALGVLRAPLAIGQRGLVHGGGRIAELTLRVLRAAGHDAMAWEPGTPPPAALGGVADWIVEARATDEALAAIVDAVRPGGMVVLKSRPAQPVALDVAAAVRKEITLVARSYGDFGEAMEWLGSGRVRVDDLAGEVFPLARFEAAFDLARRDERRKIFFGVDAAPEPERGWS
jgi:L-iditol 2-dehydrogenase